MSNERHALIDGLRACAEFLEQNPDMPTPSPAGFHAFVLRDELMALARKAGWTKYYDANYFALRKHFGPISYELFIDRSEVCRRVSKGTRIVPSQPEQVVEYFEWVCDDPVLGGGER